uniref:Hypoxia-inducible factor 1-alpha inhibitor n=1 Tax=Phallusia mammillata TaxID=59560 RepID=A0A6F9DF42_9ASCI|nr:hypoxia-inducible factor 1-alpha inhibitor [Phallusia mammillata]
MKSREMCDEQMLVEEPMSDSPISMNQSYDPASIPEYPFPMEQIPRMSINDPRLQHLIETSQPVVITDSQLVQPALKWNLRYLKSNLGDGLYYVYSSHNNRFKYFDKERAKQCSSFKQPTTRKEVAFSDFIEMLKKCNESTERIYLQQTLNDTVGPNIVQDYLQFNWHFVSRIQSKMQWGDLSSNLLLIGQEGNITPVHYDEQENFFAQVSGFKRCLLFSPDQFECLYPHPVSHPCDRQSQVNFSNPDYQRFPKFRDAHAVEAIVGPGDVLYIPMYWWHQIESLASAEPYDHGFTDDAASSCGSDTSDEDIPPVTVSVNFWYRSSPLPQQIEYPISAQQRVSVMRNIEKMVGAVMGSPDEVANLLRTIVDGRYNMTSREAT